MIVPFFFDMWFYICGQLQSCVTVCKDAFSKIMVCVCFFSLGPTFTRPFPVFFVVESTKPGDVCFFQNGANRLGDIKPRKGEVLWRGKVISC